MHEFIEYKKKINKDIDSFDSICANLLMEYQEKLNIPKTNLKTTLHKIGLNNRMQFAEEIQEDLASSHSFYIQNNTRNLNGFYKDVSLRTGYKALKALDIRIS